MEQTSIAFAAPLKIIARITSVLLVVLVFLFALDLMSDAFQNLSRNTVDSIISAASNPFVGLFIGLLITALIQSSSTSTTLIVTAVASGSLNLADAVPIIMGANIGTTITSTIVALGFIGNRETFGRALSAATVHDFFNILVVLILFPLELNYHFLSSLADQIASLMSNDVLPVSLKSIQFTFFDFSYFTDLYTSIIDNSVVNLLVSFVLLFASIKILANIISNLLMGDSQKHLNNFIFNGTTKSFLWGTLVTAGVQSSSITTSIVVPIVATDKISLKKITPFILGANVGTTITAFIAVFFKSYEAVNIAIVHLLFNVIGVIIFLPFPWLRKIPVTLAERFAALAAKHRVFVIIYIILVFFIVPFFLIYFTRD